MQWIIVIIVALGTSWERSWRGIHFLRSLRQWWYRSILGECCHSVRESTTHWDTRMDTAILWCQSVLNIGRVLGECCHFIQESTPQWDTRMDTAIMWFQSVLNIEGVWWAIIYLYINHPKDTINTDEELYSALLYHAYDEWIFTWFTLNFVLKEWLFNK